MPLVKPMRVEVALTFVAPNIAASNGNAPPPDPSASVPQYRTPLNAFTSQLPAERFSTVRAVVVALPNTAPVALRKVEVAEVKLARVANRLVEVALVKIACVAKRLVEVAFVEVEKLEKL